MGLLVRCAHPYRDLRRDQFDAVLGMVAGERPFEMTRAPMALVLWDRATGRIAPARSAAHVSVMCAGTIPESADYVVAIAGTNKRVGTVQSEFVDDCLRRGDVFVLGSSAWRMVGVERNRLQVEDAPGSTPTVPWWHGAVASRTVEVGRRVGRLRRDIAERLRDPDLVPWLRKEYHLCADGAAALVDYVREQHAAAGVVPVRLSGPTRRRTVGEARARYVWQSLRNHGGCGCGPVFVRADLPESPAPMTSHRLRHPKRGSR